MPAPTVTQTLEKSLGDTAIALCRLLAAFSREGLNACPFKGSWTAAQVAGHIIKSNTAIQQSLAGQGKITVRKPDERVGELRDIFLDFTTKLRAPNFILPGNKIYASGPLLQELEQSFVLLQQAAAKDNIPESIAHPVFGDITRLELLYFVLFHTQRHLHQLQHIFSIVERKEYSLLSYLLLPSLFIF